MSCELTPTMAPPSYIGKCYYYQWRHYDFIRRHMERDPACKHTAPDYYLDYGFKYCVQFTTNLRPWLSVAGKVWLDRARVLLQEYLEDGLLGDPSIELDNLGFRRFAFETHPNAYLDAGICNLGPWDLGLVGLEPDLAEWGEAATWEQAGTVGLVCTVVKSGQAVEAIKDSVESMFRVFRRPGSAMKFSPVIQEYFRTMYNKPIPTKREAAPSP